jgi:hypothetical protein
MMASGSFNLLRCRTFYRAAHDIIKLALAGLFAGLRAPGSTLCLHLRLLSALRLASILLLLHKSRGTGQCGIAVDNGTGSNRSAVVLNSWQTSCHRQAESFE